MDVAVGQKVLYVPDICHQHDIDRDRKRLFAFEFVGESHNKHMPYKTGDPVDFDHPALGAGLLYGTESPGVYRTGAGHHIRAARHLFAWPATIREVFPDGTVTLDIPHPSGGWTLHYGPESGKPGAKLRYSKTFEPHTWHFLEDAEGG